MSAAAPAFDPKLVKLHSTYDAPGILFALCLEDCPLVVYGAGMDGALHEVDFTAAKPAPNKKWSLHDNYVSSLVMREHDILSGSYDRSIAWTDRATGKRIRTVTAHEGWVRKIALTPSGKQLVSIGDDMHVKLWDANTAKEIATLGVHAGQTPEGYLSALYALTLSPDGKFAATGDRAGFIKIWNLVDANLETEFRAADFYTFDPQKRLRAIGGVRGLAFSPDNQELVIAGIGAVTNVDGFVGPCRMERWDWKNGKRLGIGQDKHQAILNHVVFGPSGSWVIGAGGGDGGGAIVFWDIVSNTPPFVAKPKGHLQAIALDAGGKYLYAVGHGGFQVWQLSV